MICYKLCIFISLVVVGYSNPMGPRDGPRTNKEDETMAEVTGPLNEEKFCDFPDVAEYRVYNTKWNKLDLTYRIVNYTSKWSNANVDSGIAKAVQWWSDVTPLKFTRIFSGTADIMIGFVKGDHGDGNRFKENTLTLAHASKPNHIPYSFLHFNEERVSDFSEDWETFVTVAAHEFGHNLGLAHSHDNNAVMFDAIGESKACLNSDDIRGIQSLYGANPDKTLLPKC
ncbi:collagenase 3 [Misgurnus anguillicaudatus]|uniref:collagenase 3 n=1 Tax=Misgurnus anguillicaudatus TaxID=75329 RepID=UPI003CCEF9D3